MTIIKKAASYLPGSIRRPLGRFLIGGLYQGVAMPVMGLLLRNFRLVIIEMHEPAVGAEALDRCRRAMKLAGLEKIATVGDTEAWLRPETP